MNLITARGWPVTKGWNPKARDQVWIQGPKPDITTASFVAGSQRSTSRTAR